MNQERRLISVSEPLTYRVTVQGKVSARWHNLFKQMVITIERGESESPLTLLEGTLADQAALQGLLRNLYYLGFVVLAVNCTDKLSPEIS
ncbi:MAG: hypothetical protein GTO18_13485 [Anaerolineales bacterium]|nr:hypothetical protein [Anaerolineales bacterium]